MSKSNKVIAITMGDPKGIGPEVTRKALYHIGYSARPGKAGASPAPPVVQGSFIVIGNKKDLGALPKAVHVIDIPYKHQGEGSLKFLDRGIALIKGGVADALVTAPLSKECVSKFKKGFVGHTEYLADAFDVKNYDMMFVAPQMCLTIATRHVPLKDVPRLITPKRVFDAIALMDQTLKTQFKIKNPKIAVLGLNPHAGEHGLLGHEDQKSIVPAIKKALQKGIKATGPLPADTFFIKKVVPDTTFLLKAGKVVSGTTFSGVVAMYHDQGLAPMKGLYFKDLVNFTAGLPFVRTSPVHGTAFDIAGKNVADPSSMISAIKLACHLA